MAHTDLISDLIIRLKNGGEAGKDSVVFPQTKLSLAIAEVLERQGYITVTATKKPKKIGQLLEMHLVYTAGEPKIKGVSRVSKASKRVYQKAKTVSSVKNGFGHLILSTPKGILTDKEARKEHVGGEALFKIW